MRGGGGDAAARGVGVGGELRGGGGRGDAQHGGVRARRGVGGAAPRPRGRAPLRAPRDLAHRALQPHQPHDPLPRPGRRDQSHTGDWFFFNFFFFFHF